ncbi:MAG: pyrroline-5-carboxylate reductase [Gammaproteobacteria bacterium]|nr:pyrroline-5-carboxylate reductase [Gammaproteobacteria bacterium]
MTKSTISIIGSGNMGASLVGGLIADDYPPQKIWVADLDETKLKHLKHQFNVNITTDNHEAVKVAEIVMLAIKPQVLSAVITDLKSTIQKHKPLILSIAAGIRETSLQNWLGGNIAIVRAMPNTPALIGCGASALFANKWVTQEQHNAAESILRSVGLVVWLEDENLMDIVTALSGSGPAYFFLFMEAMQLTAEKLGLPKSIARLLTLQTAFGASRMALESEESVAELRKRVTSPGGTTEQAIRVFEEASLRQIVEDALTAAKNRSEELAKQLGNPIS